MHYAGLRHQRLLSDTRTHPVFDHFSLCIADINIRLRSNDARLKLCVGDLDARFIAADAGQNRAARVVYGDGLCKTARRVLPSSGEQETSPPFSGVSGTRSRHDEQVVSEIEVTLGDLSRDPTPRGRIAFQSHPLWTLHEDDSRCVFDFTSTVFGSTSYKRATFSRDFLSGQVCLHAPYFKSRPEGLNPLEYPLDELLVVNLLGKGLGVELHACGWIDSDGKARLFVGQSEAGKTTLARQMIDQGDIEVLSDDRIVVRRNSAGAYEVHGTPWHGDAGVASPGHAPLAGIYFLRQASCNALRPLRPADAVARLVACSFLPFHDAGAIGFSLNMLEEICQRVPCQEFSFLRDRSAIQYIRRLY